MFLQRLYSQKEEGGNINADSEMQNVTLNGLYAGCALIGMGTEKGWLLTPFTCFSTGLQPLLIWGVLRGAKVGWKCDPLGYTVQGRGKH